MFIGDLLDFLIHKLQPLGTVKEFDFPCTVRQTYRQSVTYSEISGRHRGSVNQGIQCNSIHLPLFVFRLVWNFSFFLCFDCPFEGLYSRAKIIWSSELVILGILSNYENNVANIKIFNLLLHVNLWSLILILQNMQK